MAIPMPGPYEVSSTIQDILKRRRDESRQAMLDKLGYERQQDDMKTNEAQRATSAEQLMASKINSMGDTESELSPEWQAANPELYKALVERQRVRNETITPKVGTSSQAQLPEGATPEQIEAFAQSMEQNPLQDVETVGPTQSRTMFTGSQEFQRQQHDRGELSALANQPGTSDALRQFYLAQAAGSAAPPGQLLGQRNFRTVSHTGKIGAPQEMGPYDEIVNLPQPYMMPAWAGRKEYQELDPRTQQPIRTHFITPEEGAVLAQQGKILVETTTPFGGANNLGGAQNTAEREFVRAFTSTAPRSQREAELNAARTALISATVVSNPAVIPALNAASEQILAVASDRGNINANAGPAIIQRLQELFPDLTPADIASITGTVNVLLSNIPKAPAPTAAPVAPSAPTRGAAPIARRPIGD